jgi:hypothetical protein
MDDEPLPEKALYFPHLEFASSAWVKGALLYWDGLARLFGRVSPSDEPEIQELVEAGLIEPISVDPFREQIKCLFGARFADLLRQRGRLPEAIPEVRGFRGRENEFLGQEVEELAEELERQGRREAADVVRGAPFQTMPLLLTFAAHVIAGARELAPVTDDSLFSGIETYFAEESITDDPKTAPAELAGAELLIPTPSPEALAALSIAQLLEVREKLGNERREFRQRVEAHKAAIAKLPSVEAVRDHVTAFAAEIKVNLEAQRDALKAANFEEAWSIVRVTAPASISLATVAAAAESPILGPIAGIGTVALGVTHWLMHHREGHEGSGNYMLSLRTEMGRKGRGLESGLDQLLSR